MHIARHLLRHRAALAALLVAAVALLLVTCGGDDDNVTVYDEDEPILIGIATILSGELARIGEPMAEAGGIPRQRRHNPGAPHRVRPRRQPVHR